MAWRSEPVPPSSVLVTLNVTAPAATVVVTLEKLSAGLESAPPDVADAESARVPAAVIRTDTVIVATAPAASVETWQVARADVDEHAPAADEAPRIAIPPAE